MQVFLSPHFDDASLSCGGTIHRMVRDGRRVHVLTLCAGPPPSPPHSTFARRFHEASGNPEEVVAFRRVEDRTAMAALGCAFSWMDVPDAIYRRAGDRWLYTDMQTLFGGAVDPADRPIEDWIAAAAEALDPTTVYAPLGIGGHVDHRLAHGAGLRLRERGWTVRFYEDFPYADPAFPHPAGNGPETGPAGWQAYVAAFEREDLEAKIASVRAYTSQFGFLYGSREVLEERIRAFAERLVPGRPAERFWAPEAG